nr:VOC family protein [Allomuricauda sp.]
MEQNMVGWFEIPVADMDRAKGFYEAVFGVAIQVHDMGDTKMGWFPWDETKTGAAGCLIQNTDWYTPSNTEGVLIYFACTDLQQELDRVEPSGGKIVKPKTQISPDVGYMGLFLDSEGNRIALHSRN